VYLWLYAGAGALAFLLAYLLTPLVRFLAVRAGAVDRPDRRKMHIRLVARWGGLALFLSFFLTLLILYLASGRFQRLLAFKDGWLGWELIGLFCGSSLILAMGLWDDLKPIPPKIKLVVQFAAAAVLIGFGIRITGFAMPFTGDPVTLAGWVGIGLTLIWVVSLLNAINFIDGLDGLAAGVSAICAVSFLAVSLLLKGGGSVATMGHLTFTAILAAALAGACFGFLRYNFHPAWIFMGDSGSLFLGYALAAIALMGAFKTTATLSVLVPLFVLALPILDAFWVILHRLFRGLPMSKPDKSHIHHRLMAKGIDHPRTVLRVYAAAGAFALIGIVLALIR
jgi:UDP-GlcNAc:undecaprenyl-phosphate GlcNAc-1-phosphate transferase